MQRLQNGWRGAALALVVFLFAVTGAAAADAPVVRFAYQDRIGSVIPIVAVDKGFFKEAGLDVKPLQFSSGPACAEALFSGSADVAGMGDTTALNMVSRRPDMVMLASHAAGEGRHRIMVRADAPYKKLTDLRGKTIGVKKGTSTYGGLLAALKRDGMGPDAVRLVDLNPSVMATALQAGSIDAFAASEPTPSVAETKGARTLMDLSGLGNDYPIMLLSNRRYVAANHDTLVKFFAVLAKAQAYATAHPEETVQLMAKVTGLPVAATRVAMSRHVYALRLDDVIIASLAQTGAFLALEKIIDTPPDMGTVVDHSFVSQ